MSLLFVGIASAALALSPTDSLPTCAANLDSAAKRVQVNYAGFALEVRGERLVRYQRMMASLQQRALHTDGANCFPVLNALTDWFEDPHLFIFQSSQLDTAETTRRARTVATRGVTEESARQYYRSRAGRLDPIEGIWYDRGLRVAVLPDSGPHKGRYVAIVLSSDTTIWPVGSVRGTLTRRAAGRYDVELSGRNYAVAHLHGEVFRHVLLRLSPGIWGKEFPVSPADSASLDPVDVHRPTLTTRGGTIVVSIPSHDPELKPRLDSLMRSHLEELSHADRLIIDLRGNEGGSAFMADALEPFMASPQEGPDPYPSDHAVMLSTDDQIAYARRAFGSDTSAFVRGLLARMRARPNELVPLQDPGVPPAASAPRDWVVTSGPRRVGVLIDRGTVSASEVTVLIALRSTRATVYGEPTAGALDYQSVNVVRIAAGEPRWLVGYPTIARSATLPAGGMRGKGIAPQVRLDFAKVLDPIAFVAADLAKQK